MTKLKYINLLQFRIFVTQNAVTYCMVAKVWQLQSSVVEQI